MKKHLPLLLPAFASCMLLAGCGSPADIAIVGGGAAYLTQPDKPRPADLDAGMPQHESWCYATMSQQVDCYSEPQATPPGRLVNVDPPSRFPLTVKAYQDAVAKSQAGPAVSSTPAEEQAKNPLDASGVMDSQGALPPSVQPTQIIPMK